MIDSHTSINITERNQGVQAPRSHQLPVSAWALLLRVIPLMVSFILFVLAATADVQRWGSRGVQVMLVCATLLGVFGIVVFIPKRNFHK
jgi:hypothetical protein